MMSRDDAPIARLAMRRLSAPGVLNREPMQRRHDPLQHMTVTHGLAARLQSRFAPFTEARGSALVWQRSAERFDSGPAEIAQVSAPAVAQANVGAVAISRREQSPSAAPTSLQRRVTPTAESTPVVAQQLLARRQVPGLLSVDDSGRQAGAARSIGTESTLVSKLHARYGAERSDSVAKPPALSSSSPSVARITSPAPPTGVVMRRADAPSISAPATASFATSVPSESATIVATSMPLKSAASVADVATRPSSLPIPISIARKRETGSASEGARRDSALTLVSKPSRARDAATLPASTPARHPATVVERAPPLTSSTPLVLQRVMAPPVQSTPPVPYAMPVSSAATRELIEAARAPTPAEAPAAAAAASAHGGSTDIEWIAEEVGRRLRHRLEIERERKGIRSWR